MSFNNLNGKFRLEYLGLFIGITIGVLIILYLNTADLASNISDYIASEETKEMFPESETISIDTFFSDEYLNKLDKRSLAFLMKALKEKDIEAAKEYLHYCIEINYVQELEEFTPLHHAVQHGVPELVEYVLEHKIDIDAKDAYGWTPLHYASGDWFWMDYYSGSLLVEEDLIIRTEIASILLANGADVNIKDNKGKTPLQRAIHMRFNPVADLLRQYGAKE